MYYLLYLMPMTAAIAATYACSRHERFRPMAWTFLNCLATLLAILFGAILVFWFLEARL